MRGSSPSSGLPEFYPERSHIPLIASGLLRSFTSARPAQDPLDYYRALTLAVVSSFARRRFVHPGKFLRRDVWVRYGKHDYLLTPDTTFGYYLHIFEPETARGLLAQKGEVYIDLGANVGQYVVPLASCFRNVVAVEPNPLALAVLRQNLVRNGITNVEIVERAVMAMPGRTRLYRGEVLSTWSASRGGGPFVEVPATSIDELLSPFETVDLLKIDIEGAEVDAVLAAKSLGKVKCISLAVDPPDIPRIRGKLEPEGFDVPVPPPRPGHMENLLIRQKSRTAPPGPSHREANLGKS